MVFGTLEREHLDDIQKPEDFEEAFSDEVDNGTRKIANDSVE